jgi:hypothetical protein
MILSTLGGREMKDEATLASYQVFPDETILLAQDAKIQDTASVEYNRLLALPPHMLHKYRVTAIYGVNRKCRFYCPATFDELLYEIT